MSSSSSSNSDVESNSTQRESMIEQFKNVTGTNNDSAKAILEACNWNLELAINMHVDGIESNDVQIPINRTNSNNLSSSVSSQANNPLDSDFVRAPIPPVRQILVEDGYEPAIMPRRPNTNAVFDAFRDFQSEARWQERLQASSLNGESSLDQSTISKKQTLEDLYRPPLDIMFRGTLEAAKEEGTKQNRWLLVNIQNVKEFACQILNRDVWSNSTVKEIIKDHFIFWQVCHEQTEGQRFIQFYNIHEYPHVSILDPRTGEKLNSFSASDVDSLCNFITEFINEHPTPNGNKQTPPSIPTGAPTASSSNSQNKIYDQSEEAQLKAAIAASLKEASNKKDDSDSSIEECEIFEDVQIEEVKENWKDFLAPEDGKEAQFKIRLPDGSFDQISFPANSQIKALILYISSKGFDTNKYDLTTPFPRRTLNNLNSSETLIQANLYPRTTIHIQEK